MARGAVVSIAHGAGPMPVLGGPGHEDIVQTLSQDVPNILKINTADAPKAIIIVTAHWESQQPTISNAPNHDLLYDYGGFSRAAYELKYDAPGAPEIAQEIYSAFQEKGLNPKMDEKRGWDHGVFIPMLLINPSASIPIVQVSVLSSGDPATLFQMGEALEKLRDNNIAIIGSGSATFHHKKTYFKYRLTMSRFHKIEDEWMTALDEAVATEDRTIRAKKMATWRDMPHAYKMHPKGSPEHFSPLIVCAGAGGDGAVNMKVGRMMGTKQTTYWWS